MFYVGLWVVGICSRNWIFFLNTSRQGLLSDGFSFVLIFWFFGFKLLWISIVDLWGGRRKRKWIMMGHATC